MGQNRIEFALFRFVAFNGVLAVICMVLVIEACAPSSLAFKHLIFSSLYLLEFFPPNSPFGKFFSSFTTWKTELETFILIKLVF